MEMKSKSLDGINEITYDTKTGITTTTLVHNIDFKKYKKMYGGENEIFKILLEELKKGTFSDCDEEFQYCCYQIISNLQQENQELKKHLEELKSTNKVLSEELTKDRILNQDCLTTCCGIPIGDIPKLINQQKEFIEYMNKTIEELECDDVDDEELKGYLIQRIDTFKEILVKYKQIIGDDK